MSRNAKRERRVSGSSENTNEKLKGRVRELAKEVEKWKRYALSLEKQSHLTPEKLEQLKNSKKIKKEEREKEKVSNRKICERCGSSNISKKELYTPTKTRFSWFCGDCKHREEINE